MSREIRIRTKRTREGPDYRVALYDDIGRFVLTARVYELNELAARAIAEYLDSGRLTVFAATAIRRSSASAEP